MFLFIIVVVIVNIIIIRKPERADNNWRLAYFFFHLSASQAIDLLEAMASKPLILPSNPVHCFVDLAGLGGLGP